MLNFEKRFLARKIVVDAYINTIVFNAKLPWYSVWFGRFIPWMISTAFIGTHTFKYFFYWFYLFLFVFPVLLRTNSFIFFN